MHPVRGSIALRVNLGKRARRRIHSTSLSPRFSHPMGLSHLGVWLCSAADSQRPSMAKRPSWCQRWLRLLPLSRLPPNCVGSLCLLVLSTAMCGRSPCLASNCKRHPRRPSVRHILLGGLARHWHRRASSSFMSGFPLAIGPEHVLPRRRGLLLARQNAASVC